MHTPLSLGQLKAELGERRAAWVALREYESLQLGIMKTRRSHRCNAELHVCMRCWCWCVGVLVCLCLCLCLCLCWLWFLWCFSVSWAGLKKVELKRTGTVKLAESRRKSKTSTFTSMV